MDETVEHEKGQKIFTEKIKNKIDEIEKSDEFIVDHLTVMIVGKTGVGKSTLVNGVFNEELAKTGVGSIVTQELTHVYKSSKIPFLRLVDTRGIELKDQYSPNNIKNGCVEYIQKQIRNNKKDDFVQCIWYCITGARFEDPEVEVLNGLKGAYGENKIPIIIVFTQATDVKIVNEIKDYIFNKKRIDAEFIPVLAKKKLVFNGKYIDAFGLDKLLSVTLIKTKKAFEGDLSILLTNSISQKIINDLKNENKLISEYSYENIILSTIKEFKKVLSDLDFKKFIKKILQRCIFFYLDKPNEEEENDIKVETQENYVSSFIDNCRNSYIRTAKDIIDSIMHEQIFEFFDLQVKVQKNCGESINPRNRKGKEEFEIFIRNFLNDNFYYVAQKYLIKLFINNFAKIVCDAYKEKFDFIITNKMQNSEIKNLIKNCFLKKFSKLEKDINNYKKNSGLNFESNIDYNVPINYNQKESHSPAPLSYNHNVNEEYKEDNYYPSINEIYDNY